LPPPLREALRVKSKACLQSPARGHKEGAITEAVRDLEQSAELNPAAGTCLYDLAVAYSLSGHQENAIGILRKILAIEGSHCDAHYYLGTIYDSTRDKAAARREWLHSVSCQEEELKSRSNEVSDYIEIAIARTRLGDAAGAQNAETKAPRPKRARSIRCYTSTLPGCARCKDKPERP